MLLPRTAERCIICLKEPPFPTGFDFTEEHIIPKAIGGVLTCEFLCKKCNDKFGDSFEAGVRFDPAIRIAAHNLRDILPALHSSIEQRQRYKVKTSVGHMPSVFRGRKVKELSKTLEDGSLMVSSEETESALLKKMQRSGRTKEEIAAAFEIFKSAQEEVPIKIARDLVVAKRQAFDGGPELSKSKLLSPLVSLKIAYEFAVLAFGTPVLAETPALNEIRRTLIEHDANSPACRVDLLFAQDRKYEPFHGIAFEGNSPYAKFQVRLFGYLAYRVHFPNLSFDQEPFKYTHNLKTDEEWVSPMISKMQ